MPVRMTRRFFVAALGACGVLPAQAAWLPTGRVDFGQRLIEIYGSDSAKTVCVRCGLGGDRTMLVEQICPDRSERRRLAEASHAKLAAWLQDRMAEDFSVGRIEKLDGWMLSQTEISLLKLVGGSV